MTTGRSSRADATALAGEPVAGRFALISLRAARWTLWSLLRARRSLRADGLQAKVAPPPRLSWSARRGVYTVLRRTSPTCLERAIVMQAWLAAHGRLHDVVVGVASTEGRMCAHAWIDAGTAPPDADGYRELTRIPPQ